MSKTKKRIILGSVCVILLLALIGGTTAWFLSNEEVSVTYGNSIFCEAGDSLEIALVDSQGNPGRWSSTIDYSAGEYTTVDISGDGTKLFRPELVDEYLQPVNMTPAVSSLESAKSYDYVEMIVAFRSVSSMNVYLSDESAIAPVDPNNTTNMYGSSFSRDYIAGAMRVAVIDYDTNELLMLWAPNAQYELAEERGQYGYKYTFKTDGTPEQNYYFYTDQNGDLEKIKVPVDYYATKKFVVDSTGAIKGYSGNSPALICLRPESEGAHAEKTVRIRIWFEGTDREAHQALAGGNVNVKLKFIGIDKKLDATKQAAIDALTFNPDSGHISGMLEGMVFSTDGRTWTEYQPGVALPTLAKDESIFVKYPESDTFETSVRKFTKN